MGRIILILPIFIFCCNVNYETAINNSNDIISMQIKEQPPYLFKSLIISPVESGFNYMQKFFPNSQSGKAETMPALYYASKIYKYDYLLSLVTNKKMHHDFRLFAFYLLARDKDNRIISKEIEQYITQQITITNIQHLIDNKIEFYSYLPFTNMPTIDAIKQRFYNSTNYIECYSAYVYLNKFKRIENRDLLIKIPEVKDPLRSILSTKIDTNKDISLLRTIIRPILQVPKNEQFFLVLLMLADELSISKFSYLELFKNPKLMNNFFDKESIAVTALLSGRAKGDSYNEYLTYILRSSEKGANNWSLGYPPVYDILSLEKKEKRITKTIRYLLRNGNEEIIEKLLYGRELHYSEIPLVCRMLESKNAKLRLLTALRIVRADELHRKCTLTNK